jgi:hypothetical protein
VCDAISLGDGGSGAVSVGAALLVPLPLDREVLGGAAGAACGSGSVLGETADRDAAPFSPQPADARIPRSAQAAALLAVRAGRGTTASGSDRIGAETLAGLSLYPV